MDQGNFKWNISNDGFSMKVTFHAKVTNLGIGHNYDVVASATKVPVSYTKYYDEATQSYAVSNTHLQIDDTILTITSMTPENEKNKEKIVGLMKSELIPAINKNFAEINQ